MQRSCEIVTVTAMAHAQSEHKTIPTNDDATRYELVYFNFRGRAELSRLLFAVAGIEYTDTRIASMEQWIDLKKTLPCGQLPMLKINGEQRLYQSHTIARYLAKQFGLCGKNGLHEAQCDMVVDYVIDVMDPIQPAYREKDEAKKIELRNQYEDLLPGFLTNMENLLRTNNDGTGYFVGEELTWADVAVMNAWHWIPGFGVFPKLHDYPLLEAHKERIEENDRIKEWLETRPITPV